MAVTDPIADLLTRIRNANSAYHDTVEISASKLIEEIVKVLAREGYVRSYERIDDGKQGIIKVHLKYAGKKDKVLTNLKRVSKPGLRIYTKRGTVPKVLAGLGIAILTTSRGILTDQEARRLGIGGEILCYVW